MVLPSLGEEGGIFCFGGLGFGNKLKVGSRALFRMAENIISELPYGNQFGEIKFQSFPMETLNGTIWFH